MAHDEARALDNNSIGSETLRLGLVREGEGTAGEALAALGVDLDRRRREIRSLQEATWPVERVDVLCAVLSGKGIHRARRE